MTKFFMAREVIEDENNSELTFIASYATKELAMQSLYTLAAVLNSKVDFTPSDIPGDPCTWCWSVTDYSGAMYRIYEEYVDENGNIIDDPLF